MEFSKLQMMLIADEDDEDFVHCGECWRRGKDGICEWANQFVPTFGFCHMGTSKEDYQRIQVKRTELEKK